MTPESVQACIVDPTKALPLLKELLQTSHLPALEAYLQKSTSNRALLSRIASRALEYPSAFPDPLHLLSPGDLLTLSCYQISIILSNAFFCAFEDQGVGKCARLSFDSLFNLAANPQSNAKLNCLMHYFDRVTEDGVDLHQKVTFERLQCTQFPSWGRLDQTRLYPFSIQSHGSIEEDGQGMLQLDFANKCIGGGVLRHGLVQEEILFLIKPECLVSRLITSELQDHEALLIRGAQRYSKHQGYRQSFRWMGDYRETIEESLDGHLRTEILAIDAYDFSSNPRRQFQEKYILRELNKAYVGFSSQSPVLGNKCPIATGNWGCGAFGGDRETKFLIQWIVASVVQRPMVYFTFGDVPLMEHARQLGARLLQSEISVGQLARALLSYEADQGSKTTMFSFIERTIL